ncbi:hypothetical protein HYH03_011490 [Edaphochlamys debaryana]|uniref:Plastid division regulator MinE n=1 Tax=Edaphochlamys debaryana TaxID=47281 RepID=A0A835XZZ9_9CHLO|nr:hypothetical protein HYH03_011490 [Edaphochlamys debaryana]|eukprot:KAG2490025.1 hypothetical protein HYH03_011490 [Edaphochlamys debaryana]
MSSLGLQVPRLLGGYRMAAPRRACVGHLAGKGVRQARAVHAGAVARAPAQRPASGNAVNDLIYKLQLCFKIFFPDKPVDVTPKEEVKRRLKMVLVADRCGMSPSSLGELKKTIAKALQDFVDIDDEEAIEVHIDDDPSLGTVYSVAIPVRRVKAEARFSDGRIETTSSDGVTLEWDPADLNSDPSSRFPYGC